MNMQTLKSAGESIDLSKENIDALVVSNKKEITVYAAETADKIYRILIEKMHEGAVTLNKEGIILYCNSYFAGLLQIPLQKAIGANFIDFIPESSKGIVKTLIKQGRDNAGKAEAYLNSNDGKLVPVLMSVNVLMMDGAFFLSIILTDLTILTKNQEELQDGANLLKQKNLELANVNRQLSFQNSEKEKRAIELELANTELAFQNSEKEKRAGELELANTELAFQNREKEKRAEELELANIELAFQNREKEKRAEELELANIELAFQNREKEKRAEELELANIELAFQNREKEKRADELMLANQELKAFNFLSSHDLQEPLRKIQMLSALVLDRETLSRKGMDHFRRMKLAAGTMRQLIDDLITYSRMNTSEYSFIKTNLNTVIKEVLTELEDDIKEKNAIFEIAELDQVNIVPFQFRQLMLNLISNSLKFSHARRTPKITISSRIEKGEALENKKLAPDEFYCHIMVQDNGIGFESHFSERIFEVFKRLHGKEVYPGTGIGLAIVKKIVENHKGFITSSGNPNKGARFDIFFPEN
jgi:PAS domain S-box-containing protein